MGGDGIAAGRENRKRRCDRLQLPAMEYPRRLAPSGEGRVWKVPASVPRVDQDLDVGLLVSKYTTE